MGRIVWDSLKVVDSSLANYCMCMLAHSIRIHATNYVYIAVYYLMVYACCNVLSVKQVNKNGLHRHYLAWKHFPNEHLVH